MIVLQNRKNEKSSMETNFHVKFDMDYILSKTQQFDKQSMEKTYINHCIFFNGINVVVAKELIAHRLYQLYKIYTKKIS